MRHLIAAAALAAAAVPTLAQSDDPYVWLEEFESPKALAQVETWNKATADVLTKAPGFDAYRSRALAILDDPAKIATPTAIQGEWVTNLWQDARNTHGLWRRATVASVMAGKPDWQLLIDVDALSKLEGKNWVFEGANCLQPAYDRCLVGLSDGGTDALTWREFDMGTRQFIKDGFVSPEAKARVAWADRDHLLIATDFGPGSLTTSGYSRRVKLWQRGTPLTSATMVYEGQTSDVSAAASVAVEGATRYPMIIRGTDFFHNDVFHMAPGGKLVRSPIPNDADIEDVLDGRAIVRLQTDWSTGGTTYKGGSLVAYPIAPLLAGRPAPVETVFAPSGTQAIEQVSAADTKLYIKLLDNVSGKLVALTRQPNGQWAQAPVALPANSVVTLHAAGKHDVAFVGVEGLLQPESLWGVRPGAAPKQVASLKPAFDASKMEATQRFATSKDGTRIPYFLVRPKGARGPIPTIVHAYGGFRLAQSPTYLTKNPFRIGPVAVFWVEEGGAFVIANIRGGGEFGPKWHESVLKANRQKAFDDYYAVAEDLKKQGISSKVAASGRSNGGLLAGVAFTQRPDLYDGAIVGVPLADMRRYNQIGAGASWMAEYGNPDKPEEWAYLSKYSPYQALRKDAKYPKVMLYTSTKDDRVSPAHARKMAARMEEQGHPFYYYENINGGHAGAANHDEDAYRSALMMAYLNRELRGK